MKSFYEAMTLLTNHGLKNMSLDELKWLSCATDLAEGEARRLGSVCEDIACLVANDDRAGLKSGNFQNADDVFGLLCVLSHNLNTIAGMIYLGTEAEHKAQELSKATPTA